MIEEPSLDGLRRLKKRPQFDIIILDYVLEHLSDVEFVFCEIDRILKVGGYICARTPNKYGYISIATRLIRNQYHENIVSALQPGRKKEDIFPTYFRCNTLKDLYKYFGNVKYASYSYYYNAEPAYFMNNRILFGTLIAFNYLLPSFLRANIFIFLRKLKWFGRLAGMSPAMTDARMRSRTGRPIKTRTDRTRALGTWPRRSARTKLTEPDRFHNPWTRF